MADTEEPMEVTDVVGDNSVSRVDGSMILFSIFWINLTPFSQFLFQNGSSSASDAASSRGKEGDFESKIEIDRSKRFDFLLKQTEIFSHFMTNAPKATSPPKAKAGRPKKIKDKDSESGNLAEYVPNLKPVSGIIYLVKSSQIS